MRILFLLSLLSLQWTLFAQNQSNNWHTDYDKAFESAASSGKQVLMIFGGSDWCRPCIKLKKEILEDPAFAENTTDKLVVLYLDFPVRKKNKLPETQAKQNESLAARYNPKGVFPRILLFQPDKTLSKVVEYKNQTYQKFLYEIL